MKMILSNRVLCLPYHPPRRLRGGGLPTSARRARQREPISTTGGGVCEDARVAATASSLREATSAYPAVLPGRAGVHFSAAAERHRAALSESGDVRQQSRGSIICQRQCARNIYVYIKAL